MDHRSLSIWVNSKPLFFLTSMVVCWLLTVSVGYSQSPGGRHPRAPETGRYSSSRMTSWLTVTPYSAGDPRMNSTQNKVDYGVGSMPFKGLFGDLILHEDGSYSLTEDKHGGTWKYIPGKDSVAFSGWLSTFKTRYDYGERYLTIYTGDVKMPDGGTLNISYTKKREKPYNKQE